MGSTDTWALSLARTDGGREMDGQLIRFKPFGSLESGTLIW
jgi:hypothetical protein